MNVQERLQLKRIPLDQWSTREQLCLAMAVLCSGDQNWMSVSRALKMMCGTNRPTDWFSQKFCAAQYGKLLENVETPKRKKRTISERDNPADATIIPGEIIVRKLAQERTIELKKLVEEEQREYRQLLQDIKALESDSLDDAQVLAMWEQIEQENHEKEKEAQKHAQWLKEREERKIEMERAWRPGAIVAASMSPTSNSNSSGSPSRSSPSLFLKATGAAPSGSMTPKAEPMDQSMDTSITTDTPIKQGASPLLTSLLKSPSSTPSTPTAQSTQQQIAATTVAPRSLAPTITNLLTGGGSGQPQVQTGSSSGFTATQNVPNVGSSFFNFPSKHPQHQQPATSPSKAAPTLSKLLDSSRNKGVASGGSGDSQQQQLQQQGPVQGQQSTVVSVEGAVDEAAINIEDDQLLEVFKELMPDDLADILTDNTEMIVTPELLDQDLAKIQELIQPNNATNVHQQVTVAAPVPVIVQEEEQGGEKKEPVQQEFPHPIETVPDNSKNEAEGMTEEETPPVEVRETEVVEATADDDDMMELDDPVVPTEQVEEVEQPDASKLETIEESVDDGGQDQVVADNLEEQLEAITNGCGGDAAQEVKSNAAEEENAIVNTSADVIPEEKDFPEQIPIEIEENVANENQDQEVIESEQLDKSDIIEQVVEEEKEVDEKPEAPGNDQSEMVVDSAKESPVTETTEETADPEQHEQPTAAAIEERKVSTDVEDHFEDAKSTIGDNSGNPPDDAEMKEPKENVTVPPVEENKKPAEVPSTPEVSSDRSSRSKRDMPRRNRSSTAPEEKSTPKPQLTEDSGEETKSSSASNISLRARLRERERSESPLVMDEDTSDMVIPRTRRRYSSTPVIDSVPSSPASGDDREYKNWKKTVLIAFNQFSTLHYKYSAVLVQQVPEEFRHVILRPMDMQTIKKNIETGVIRTTAEFQRDVLLMVQNAIMMNTRRDKDWTNLINEMMAEVDSWRRETEKNLNARDSDSGAGASNRDSQGKVRNRKSMRITTAT